MADVRGPGGELVTGHGLGRAPAGLGFLIRVLLASRMSERDDGVRSAARVPSLTIGVPRLGPTGAATADPLALLVEPLLFSHRARRHPGLCLSIRPAVPR